MRKTVCLIGRPNTICVCAADVPLLGRVSTGNIMIKNSSINKIVKL